MYAWANNSKQSADDLAIEVSWKFSEDEPHRVSELLMTWEWPSLPQQRRRAVDRVAEMCTIHATLHQPPTVITRERGQSNGGGQPDEAMAGAHVPAAGESREHPHHHES
jgi:uncharacterized OsmC-like protein